MGFIKKAIASLDRIVDLQRFFKFGLTGLVNTAVDWLVFTMCDKLFSLDAVTSQAAGQIIATVNSFFVNKYFTFGNRDRPRVTEALRFACVALLSLGVSLLLMHIFEQRLGINRYVCKAFIVPATLTVNYFGTRLFVFGRGGSTDHNNKRD